MESGGCQHGSRKRFFWALLTVFAYFVAFDVGGVIAEVLSMDFAALIYTIWIVAGVFCGLFAYDSACRRLAQVELGDWSAAPDSSKWGLVTLSATATMLGISTELLYRIEWKAVASQSHFVPDSMPLTVTFFTTILVSMIVGHTVLRPRGNRTK